MSDCESRDVCSFFTNEMKALSSIVRTMKARYCEGNKENCARYMVKRKLYDGYTLPDDSALMEVEKDLAHMYPNDLEKAKRIISMMTQ